MILLILRPTPCLWGSSSTGTLESSSGMIPFTSSLKPLWFFFPFGGFFRAHPQRGCLFRTAADSGRSLYERISVIVPFSSEMVLCYASGLYQCKSNLVEYVICELPLFCHECHRGVFGSDMSRHLVETPVFMQYATLYAAGGCIDVRRLLHTSSEYLKYSHHKFRYGHFIPNARLFHMVPSSTISARASLCSNRTPKVQL